MPRDRPAEIPVAVSSLDSPLGTLVVAVTCGSLVRLALPCDPFDRVIAELRSRLGRPAVEDSVPIRPVREELDEYFAGRRRAFTIPIDLSLAGGFRRTLLQTLAAVPYGATLTYSELATRAGRPRAARAAGQACTTNPIAVVIPCHRVLRSDGGLGGFASGLDHKRFLLALELGGAPGS